jgi:hypothetical protein
MSSKSKKSENADKEIDVESHGDCKYEERPSCKICTWKALQIIKACLTSSDSYIITPSRALRLDTSTIYTTCGKCSVKHPFSDMKAANDE